MTDNNNGRPLSDLKAEFDLHAMVSRDVRLTRRGGVWQGLCPFHAEKTPSFFVYPGHYHCYGCGAHGDVLSYMAAVEQIPVGELIRSLRRNDRVAGGPSPEALQRIAENRRRAEALANEPPRYRLADTVPPGVPPLWQGPGHRSALILRPKAELGEALTLCVSVERMHEYRGGRGELLGYVLRGPKDQRGNKSCYSVAWAHDVRLADGSVCDAGWTFVSFPSPRSVYGCEAITQAHEYSQPVRILVVEGEKCQEAATAALSRSDDWIPVTWIGGTNTWTKTDWAQIAEADEIVLWPDADINRAGQTAMQRLAEHLLGLGATNIRVVYPPAGVTDGWDVAEAIEDHGWTTDQVRGLIQNAQPWTPPLSLPPGADQIVPGGIPPEPLPGSGAKTPANDLEMFVSTRLSFQEAMMNREPVLEFLLPGMLRGTVALLVGPGGTGKSWAMLQTCISVACGLDIWGLWGGAFGVLPKGKVIYIAAEDPSLVVTWRQHHLGRDVARRVAEFNKYAGSRIDLNQLVNTVEANLHTFSMSGHGNEKQLAIRPDRRDTTLVPGPLYYRIIELGQGAILTCLDTWGRVTTALDEREGTDMGQAVDLCESLTLKCPGLSILIAHHTTKAATLGGHGSEQQAASGSRKLTDHVRWQANLETMSADSGEVRGYDDKERRKWVAISTPKVNYAENEGTLWWHRGENGILEGAVPQEKPPSKPGETLRRKLAGGK